MFRLRLPMAIMISSGSLLLLTIGSLLLISSVAHTSETESIDKQINPSKYEDQVAQHLGVERAENVTSRRRAARFFNHQDGSTYGSQKSEGQQQQQQQQERSMSMESYAAALAAANSVDHSNGSADLVQSTIPANDAASFGEQSVPPPASPSAARQYEATEYSPVHAATGGSYHHTASGPSANAYLPNHLGHASSGTYHNYHHHHSPAHTSQSYHQSAPSTYSHHQYGAATKKISAASLPPLGYPSYDHWSSPGYFADRSGAYPPMPYWSSPSHISTSSGFGSSLMSSASSALSHWTGGFGVAEIICGIVALSIGAVILGAPFFLIYLALMGNFSGSSTLSLTNPNQSGMTTGGPGGAGTTTVNGRRKRLAIFEPATTIGGGGLDQAEIQYSALANSVIGQLSPFVDIQQITATFKKLVESIEKYSKLNAHNSLKDNNAAKVSQDLRRKL